MLAQKETKRREMMCEIFDLASKWFFNAISLIYSIYHKKNIWQFAHRIDLDKISIF